MTNDIHIRLPAGMVEQLDGYCSWRHTTRTLAVYNAIKQLLEHAEQPQPSRWHP